MKAPTFGRKLDTTTTTVIPSEAQRSREPALSEAEGDPQFVLLKIVTLSEDEASPSPRFSTI